METRVVFRQYRTTVYGDRNFFTTLAREARELAEAPDGAYSEIHFDGFAKFYVEMGSDGGEFRPVQRVPALEYDLNMMRLEPNDFAKFDETLKVVGKE